MTVFQRLPSGKAAELTIRWYARYGPRLVAALYKEQATAGRMSPQHEAALAAICAASIEVQDALSAAGRRSTVELCAGTALLGVGLLGFAKLGWSVELAGGAVLAFVVGAVRGFARIARVPRFRQVYAKLEKEAEEHLRAP